MYVYGGPGSQLVLNRWSVSMENWLTRVAREGYIIYCVDGRGTGGRGAAFEKQIYRRMGELELIDQVAAARKIGELPYVDKNRIGIFGWSFGGYMASLCATRHSDVFCAAIAVAPVTSWRMYDTVYTERFLSTPQENPQGYDQNSPLTYASDMKCRFLLVHGTADDNVHYQNSARFSSLLVEAGVPFEQMIYTDKNHSIRGGNTTAHLHNVLTSFIIRNL
jgi:dipeptidyl-peptidase-4